MKAILLAGGTGTRLHPLTLGVNKHLLPVGKQPMIGHALRFLHNVGVTAVTIVTTPEDLSGYGRLIAADQPPYSSFSGIYLAVQRGPKGIADAIKYGQAFAGDDPVLVMLADNLFDHKDELAISNAVRNFHHGCHVWVTKTDKPEHVGVLVLEDDRPSKCVEKPQQFISDLGIGGLYLFDHQVWDYAHNLQPSARGELEVTDLLNAYVGQNQLSYSQLQGDWLDLGQSIDQFLDTCVKVIRCTSS